MGICPSCGINKTKENTYRDSSRKNGLAAWCKACASIKNKTIYAETRQRYSRIKSLLRKRWLRCAECGAWMTTQFLKTICCSKNCYLRHSRKRNPAKRLNGSVSTSVYLALREAKAGRPWEELVGFTMQDLRKHLESQFQKGMTWENFGKWELDHKIPISAFNFKGPEDIDFRRCWSLSNLQPLWKIENRTKNAKIERPFQPSLAHV